MLSLSLSLAVLAVPTPQLDHVELPEPGLCAPADEKLKPTKEQRAETFARVAAACKRAGAAPIVCAYFDAVVMRESHGNAGVRHYVGKNENGLGPMGLSLRWNAKKWPGTDEDPMFCHPEVSFAVALRYVEKAITKYGARNFLEIQAVYGGSTECYVPLGEERKVCRPIIRNHGICTRLRKRGFKCLQKVTLKDLGDPPSYDERRQWALDAIEAFNAAKQP